jgi:hypothetical protein
MIYKTLTVTLSLALLALAITGPAAADSRDAAHWSVQGSVDPAIAAKVRDAYETAQSLPAAKVGLGHPGCGGPAPVDPLVGTWRTTVSSNDFEPFEAFHTYHGDHTFTENSNLLVTLTEGPAQGAWVEFNGQYFLTFELFAYEDGAPAGIIRVRNVLEVDGPDHLSAYSVVDFVAPDGNLVPEVGTATFEGTRIRPLFVQQP